LGLARPGSRRVRPSDLACCGNRGIVAQSDMVLLLRTVATVMFKMGLVAELPTDLHVENIASDMYGCTMCGFALCWARRRWLVRWGQ
jgi:hypothetical protein